MFNSPIMGASLKKKERSLCKGAKKEECLSSKRMMSTLLCLPNGKRPIWISTYGTSDSATSTSRGFEKCRQRTSFSACHNLVVGMAKVAMPINLGRSTDFHSLTSVIGAVTNSIYSIRMCGARQRT